jgi:hypothetical protein
MDELNTTFDERVAEMRRQRREPRQEAASLSALEEIDASARPEVGLGRAFEPTVRTSGDDSDDEIEQLRRDISRLEGKVDALLNALEVKDVDE